MNKYKDKIIITTGDYNGIGAEITVKALNKLDLPVDDIAIISNKDLLTGLKKDYEIISLPISQIEYGKLTKESGESKERREQVTASSVVMRPGMLWEDMACMVSHLVIKPNPICKPIGVIIWDRCARASLSGRP